MRVMMTTLALLGAVSIPEAFQVMAGAVAWQPPVQGEVEVVDATGAWWADPIWMVVGVVVVLVLLAVIVGVAVRRNRTPVVRR